MHNNRLYATRTARGWSQVLLSKVSGVDQSLISRLERVGAADKTSWKTVRALAKALKVKPDHLFPPQETP